MTRELATTRIGQVRHELSRVIVGQDRVVDRLLVAVLADGHVLLEGAPGLGKTLLLSSLARVLGGTFSRIQFTPDLIPSDIVGTRIYRPSSEVFDVEPGPILANVVLVDEINRAPARVQSALLESMAERQVTVGGRTFPMPRPFLVVATQNPVESEGVYPLAEAQRDRFLMRIPVDYPTPAEERAIVARMADVAPQAARLLDPADVEALQAAARSVAIDEPTTDYAVRLVLATRDPIAHGLPKLVGLLDYGASPRASLGLVRSARAMALLRGRDRAIPQDVYDVAYDILNARLALSYRALAEGFTIDDVLVELLSTVPAPWGVVASPPVQPGWAQPSPTAQPAWNGQPAWVGQPGWVGQPDGQPDGQPAGTPGAYPQQQAWTGQPGVVPAAYPQQPAHPASVAQQPAVQQPVPQQPAAQQPAYPAPAPQPPVAPPVAQPVVAPTQVVSPAQIVTAGAPQSWPASDVPVKVMPGETGSGPR